MLLKRDGQVEKANGIFAEVLKRAKVAPSYYQREQREWIDIARRESGV